MRPLTVATLAVIALQTVPPAPVARHPDYGVVTSVQFLDGPSLQRIRELGIGSVRIGIDWSTVEPLPDRFDLADFRLPFWIDQAHAAGLHIFATLGGPPPWAAPCPTCMPYSLWDWYDYVAHVIAEFRYLGNDITFGIWNEPNLNKFLERSSPDLYGDLFDYADLARMDANPAARLAGPETEHGAEPSGFFAAALGRMQPHLRPQDVITVHWYPGTRSPPLLDYMQRILGRVGTRETWLTETGEFNLDDALQASRLQDIVKVFNRRPTSQWAKIFVYRLYASDPIVLDPEGPLNLLRPDYSPRPAFDAYRSIMYRVFTVSIQAANARYLAVDADPAVAVRALDPDGSSAQTFDVYDFNGGALRDGDIIRLRAANGRYLRARDADRPLTADDDCGCRDDGLFIVHGGAEDAPGDAGRVTLQSYTTNEYASLDGGRAADILVNRRAAGAREKFQLTVR